MTLFSRYKAATVALLLICSHAGIYFVAYRQGSEMNIDRLRDLRFTEHKAAEESRLAHYLMNRYRNEKALALSLDRDRKMRRKLHPNKACFHKTNPFIYTSAAGYVNQSLPPSH